MFGRRKVPFGQAGAAPPPPSPPTTPVEPFPIDKMDRALEAAIRLFTAVLDQAGKDAGALAIRGPRPTGVGQMLAECTTYNGGENGTPLYLALGITPDFRAFLYPPHCRLYFILNSVGICEDPHTQGFLASLAPSQLPEPLVDAHLMRAWIRFILPTGKAMTGGDAELAELVQAMQTAFLAVAERTPQWIAEKVNLRALLKEWASGFPGTIGKPLTREVERMNGLPVTPFISEVLVQALADLQAQGLRQRA